jgi:hypothetical protein
MPEKGSDELLRASADWSATLAGVAEEEARGEAEEDRLSEVDPATVDEPGEEYPDPGAPPPNEPHDEYNPLPPE